jgi:hypothetical protein
MHRDRYQPQSLGAAVLAVGFTFSAYLPIAVGATIENWQKLTAADARANRVFGTSVGISGSHAIIGASGDDEFGTNSGAAYMFAQDGSGHWTQRQKLHPNDLGANAAFGRSSAIDGDTAIVNANAPNGESQTAGAAYIFRKQPGGAWEQEAKLFQPDLPIANQFGVSVDISGDTAIVGSWLDDEKAESAGASYIYRRDGSGSWNLVTKLVAEDGGVGEHFGRSVSISNRTAIVGAASGVFAGSSNVAAYIFEEDDSGQWRQTAKLLKEVQSIDNTFGWSVDVSGDVAAVGDYGAGLVYVYERETDGLWHGVAKLFPPAPLPFDGFGTSVQIDGNSIVAGGSGETAHGNNAGAAYLFTKRSTSEWGLVGELVGSGVAFNDLYGHDVAISNGWSIVSAYGDDDKGDGAGAAFMFRVVPEPNTIVFAFIAIAFLPSIQRLRR